ncbi:MAG TPA: hypothetical protein VLB76_08205 [Thermoanaerobaculia bacterium]|jgi:hypothetical protein|nr:hypothetical protein [Thermoanaerobaculia bacterium]
MASASGTPATVRLDCKEGSRTTIGRQINISCRVKNEGSENIYVLSDNLALEGPKKGEHYFYVPIGWERFENVLQYNSPSAGLDMPTLFHPTAHLSFEQMKRLVILPAKCAIEVNVAWNISPESNYLEKGKWLMKIKLVYLTESRALALLKEDGLTSACRQKFAESISGSPKGRLQALKVRRSRGAADWHYDGCQDLISEKFTHLYSNPLTIQVPGP